MTHEDWQLLYPSPEDTLERDNREEAIRLILAWRDEGKHLETLKKAWAVYEAEGLPALIHFIKTFRKRRKSEVTQPLSWAEVLRRSRTTSAA